MKIKNDEIKVRLLKMHHEFHTLPEYDLKRKEELEWIFHDTIQDDTFNYKGIDIWIDDVSLIEDEVVIMAVNGQALEKGESLISLNVEEFILNCL